MNSVGRGGEGRGESEAVEERKCEDAPSIAGAGCKSGSQHSDGKGSDDGSQRREQGAVVGCGCLERQKSSVGRRYGE